MTLRSITRPRCGRTSWNPNDVREGFCGHCHDWTSRPDPDNPDPTPTTPKGTR